MDDTIFGMDIFFLNFLSDMLFSTFPQFIKLRKNIYFMSVLSIIIRSSQLPIMKAEEKYSYLNSILASSRPILGQTFNDIFFLEWEKYACWAFFFIDNPFQCVSELLKIPSLLPF